MFRRPSKPKPASNRIKNSDRNESGYTAGILHDISEIKRVLKITRACTHGSMYHRLSLPRTYTRGSTLRANSTVGMPTLHTQNPEMNGLCAVATEETKMEV